MNPNLETHRQTISPPNIPAKEEEYLSQRVEEIYYPTTQGDEMGESTIHYELISDFLKMLKVFFAERNDVFIAANLNVYYEQDNPQKWCAPDLMVAFGVSNTRRRIYKVWEESVFPQVIFEVASDTTWENDISKKYGDYNRLGTTEYYLLDPERAFLPQPLMAFQRENGGRLLAIYPDNRRVYSPSLGLEIVDTGDTFRLFNPSQQQFLLTLEEAETGLEQVEAELEATEAENRRLQAEIARLQEILKEKR